MGKNELTRSQYTGVDYQTAIDDLRNRLAVEFREQFNDFSVSDLAFLLLDSIAYAQDSLSFYQDQRANESFLSLAQTRNGIARVARTLGYKPIPATAAATEVQVSVTQVYAFPITFAVGYQFTGDDNLIFEVAEAVTIPANAPITDVFAIPVYQGQTFVENFTSDGSSNQTYRLSRAGATQFVASGTVVVNVNGVEWEEVEFLTFENTNQYEVDYYSTPPTVRFGNGIRGAVPPSTASIVIRYVACNGISGNISEGRIDTNVNPLVQSFQNIQFTVTNADSSVGGNDPESFDSIRANAPKVFNTRNVAVTRSDYETLAGRYASPIYGRVAVAQAINTRESSSDVYLQNNLGAIDAAASTAEATVGVQTTAGIAALATATTQLGVIDTTATLIVDANDTVASGLVTGRTAVRTAKDNVLEIGNDLNVINGYVTIGGTLRALIDGIATAGSSQLTVGDKADILAYIDTILAQNTDATTLVSTVTTGLDTGVVNISTAIETVQDVGTTSTLAGSLVEDIQNAETAASTSVATGDTAFDTIDTTMNTALTDIDGYTNNISEYFSEIYSNECKSNVVTVPILAYNSEGFYVGASNSLVRDTQSYLEGIKDVTHTVKVVSGGAYLLEAVIAIRVGVLNTFSQAVVSSSITQVVDSILKNRKFAQSLYVSDLVEPLTAIAGVGFINVTISGYYDTDGITILTGKNDASGNLIAGQEDIITKGLVTITAETYIPS